MSSMKYYLGFGMLSCAGIYASVRAYKFYSSNKSEKVSCSIGEDVISNESAKVEIDGLFMFYVDSGLCFIPTIKEEMKFLADKMLMIREDGTRLEVHIRNLYEHFFERMDESVSSLKYEDSRLYIVDPNLLDPYNARANDLVGMDMNSTAEEVLQKSKELFLSGEEAPGSIKVVLRKKTNLEVFLSLLN